MKALKLILFSAATAFLLPSCETPAGGGGGDNAAYPDPNPSRTAQEVQQMHSQIHRQNF